MLCGWYRRYIIDIDYYSCYLQQCLSIDLFFCWIPGHFFISYLAAPRLTLGHYWGNSLSHLMLITALFSFEWKTTRSLVADLVPKPGWAPSGVWTGTFQILSQYLNPLGHCTQKRVGTHYNRRVLWIKVCPSFSLEVF